MSDVYVKLAADSAGLAAVAAQKILGAAQQAIAARNTFTIALSGGSTPKILFELLTTPAYASRIDFGKWEIYFGDERCVPPDHKDSNFRMASEALLNHVPIPREHVHRMRGEIDPQAAAVEYGSMLKARFGDGGIDVILLGMGDDGHTASLFPGTAALDETHHRCVANYVPKLSAWRLTLSAPFINRASAVFALISGATKRERLVQVLHGPRNYKMLPIQMIQPAGAMWWLVDRPAWQT